MPRAPRPVRAVAANYSLLRIWLTLVFVLSIIVGIVLAVQTGANAAGPRAVGVLQPSAVPVSTTSPLAVYAHRGGDNTPWVIA